MPVTVNAFPRLRAPGSPLLRRLPAHLGASVPALLVLLVLPLLLGSAAPADALVHYDQGRREIQGVQLLQDADDPATYHYIPQFPRLATRDDGTFELLCLKYVDAQGDSSGGLFHALVEFTLPPEVVEELEKELDQEQPGARIAGPVQLLQAMEDGEEGMGSFEVVSAIFSDQAEGGMTRSLVTSGKAPLSPGSKAVVAAMLEPAGATLLWDSLSGPTSDVSVAIHAYYEAKVRAYNAKVTAEMETVYQHLSRISNQQKNFSRRQMRRIVDELHQDGVLEVEVFDRTKSLGVDADDLQGILQLVTDKLTELMFDRDAGWAKEPPRETAVEANQILGRQKTGWFDRTFGGARNPKYVSDDQYVLKRRQDVRRQTFQLILSQDTTIKVPVDTAGNLGGLYDELKEDPRYFRVVDLDDPDFETRTVHFQVDGAYLDAFEDTVNHVAVNFRKSYPHREPVTDSLLFTHEDVSQGRTLKEITFARLGVDDEEWTEFEYQVSWSLRDRPTVTVPAREDDWISSQRAAVALVPPFEKRVVEVDADRGLFGERGVRRALVEFATVLAGQPKIARTVVLRPEDAEASSRVALYFDPEETVARRVSWYLDDGERLADLDELTSDYLFLMPPQPPTLEPSTPDPSATQPSASQPASDGDAASAPEPGSEGGAASDPAAGEGGR